MNEYGGLYHEATGAQAEHVPGPELPVEDFPNLDAYLPVFEAYASSHATDADFTYDHTEFLRKYRARDKAFEKHFASLAKTLRLCSECHERAIEGTYCRRHYIDKVIDPEMQELNDRHNHEQPLNDDATAVLQEYLETNDDTTPLEDLKDICQRYKESLDGPSRRLRAVDENEEEEDDSLLSSSSSLDEFLDAHLVTPFGRIQPPTEDKENVSSSSSSSSSDDEEEEEEEEEDEEEEEEEHVSSVETMSRKRPRDTSSLSLVNKTCDHLLSTFDEQLPEGAKTCLKLLRDGDGSRRALEQLLDTSPCQYQFDVVSTIVSSGVVVYNETFGTYEDANEYLNQFAPTEHVCRSIVKRKIN